MLKGDLATTPLPEVLRSLARSSSTGCLRVRVGQDAVGEAKVFVRTGKVYAVVLPDRRPQLGPRLVSSGDLDPAALAEAYDAQRTELQGWRLGELLVHLGYVEQDVVEQAVGEQLREAAFELTLWTAGTWRFRTDERTREDVAPAVDVDTLLADLTSFADAWDVLRPRVHGPDAVPVLSAAGTSPDTLSLDGDAWSLLCTVDGTSSLSRLAGSSGLSLLEAAQVVVTLVDAGLVEIEAGSEPAIEPVSEPVAVEPVAPVLTLVPELEPDLEPASDTAPAAIASRLAEALRGLGPMPVLAPYPLDEPSAVAKPAAEVEPEPEPEPAATIEVEPEPEPIPSPRPADLGLSSTALEGEALSRSLTPSVDDLSVAGSITRASESLAVTLGHTDEEHDPFAVSSASLAPPHLPPLEEREARRRALDAQELSERHAELEAERAAERDRAQDMQLARQAMTELAGEPLHAADDETQDEHVLPEPTDEAAPVAAPVAVAVAVAVSEHDRRAAAEMQAAAFAELSQAASAGVFEPAPAVEPEPVAALAPAPEAAPAPYDAPSAPPRGADTAALLRELSSLGLEDEPESVPHQRAAAPPVVRPLTSVGAKKRKGLFGRG